LAGCSDSPNSIGTNLIKTDEKFVIADDTLYTVKDTVFNVSSLNGYGINTVVGKSNDVEAVAWLRFISGTLKDSLKSCTIDTVQLHLTVSYTWNAPTLPGEYQIFEALSGWSQTGATRDSLPMMQIGTNVLGRITDTLSVNKEIVVPLDSTAMRRWIATLTDSGAAPMHGFVIKAKPGTTPGAFGYYSSTAVAGFPRLVVHYVGTNGVRDSLSFIISEDTFIASAQTSINPTELEVRAGVSTWSKLQFNVSELSKAAIINNATLQLTQKSSGSRLGAGTPDSLYAFLSKAGGSVSTIDSSYRLLGRRKTNTSTTDPVYVFTVTQYLQFMIASGTPYDGIVVHAAYNNASIDHMAFYSSKEADQTKRPALFVTTSKK
jgi:hypothetical protein